MIVITLVRIDRWTKYYFGPRIGQTQAEGKNHMCQGGLFKASPHYTVSSNVTHTRAYWTRHTFEAIEKNPKFNQTQKEERKTHQRNSIHSTRLHIVKGTVRRRTHLNDIDLGFNFMRDAWITVFTFRLIRMCAGPLKQESFDFFDDYTSTVKTTQNHTEGSDLL